MVCGLDYIKKNAPSTVSATKPPVIKGFIKIKNNKKMPIQ